MGLGDLLVVKPFQADVEMDHTRRQIRQCLRNRLVRFDLGLGIRAVPLPQRRQRLREAAPMPVVPHDVPRAAHDKRLDVGQHLEPRPPAQARRVIGEVSNQRRSLAMAALEGENPSLWVECLHVAENLLESRIMAGHVVTTPITGRTVVLRVFPPGHRRLQHSGDVRQPRVLIHIAARRGKMRRCVLVGPVSPDGNPDFDMSNIRDQVGVLLKPLLAFCQAILRPFDLDCKDISKNQVKEAERNVTDCVCKCDLEPMASRPGKSGPDSRELSVAGDGVP